MENTIFDKWHPKAPYKFIAEMPGPMAGAIIRLFEEDFHLGRLNRTGLQIVFGMYFFGDACCHDHDTTVYVNRNSAHTLLAIARNVRLVESPFAFSARHSDFYDRYIL